MYHDPSCVGAGSASPAAALSCDRGGKPRSTGTLQQTATYPDWVDNQLVERTLHGAAAVIQHMGVDHRRFDIRVTLQFLDRADIVSRFQQVRREGMPEGMAGRAPANARSPDGVVVKISDPYFA